MHQGEAGLRVPSSFERAHEGRFGARDVSSSEPNAAELRQRPSEFATQVRPQLLASQKRFLLRFHPRTAQPENLGAVNSAATVDASHGLPLTPALHRLGPLLSKVVLRERLQRADDFAVNDPGREGIELPRYRCHTCFVEQSQSLRDIALEDKTARLGHTTDGGCSRSEVLAHVNRSAGPTPRFLEVAGQESFVVSNHRQPGVNRRVIQTFQELFNAIRPATNRSHQSGVEQQVHRYANGSACRGKTITSTHALSVGPLPCRDGHVEMASGVRHVCEKREVVSVQW
jgi:hypothetical protein